jgi:hypothetical protein
VVTRAAIRSMLDDVSAMEARLEPEKNWRAVSIQFPAALDENAVLARHYSLFPDDRDANVILRRILYSADPNDGDDTKDSKAWRQLAREEMAKYSPDEVRRLWASRAIKHELGVMKKDSDVDAVRYVAPAIGAIVAEYSFSEETAAEMMRAAGIDLNNADIVDLYQHGKRRAKISSGRSSLQ